MTNDSGELRFAEKIDRLVIQGESGIEICADDFVYCLNEYIKVQKYEIREFASELAEEFGIAPSTVLRWINDRSVPAKGVRSRILNSMAQKLENASRA